MRTGDKSIDMEYKEYTDRITSTIKDVIKNAVSSGNDKGEAHYLYMCLDLLKRMYQMNKNWTRFHAWSYESTEEVTHIWNTIQPELAEFIQDQLKQFRHKKMTRDIKSSSAQAVIAAAMKEAGLKYRYTGQTDMAKITVPLIKDRCLTVHIAYSKLDKQLPGIIQSLKNIRKELDALGNALTINKVQGTWTW